jgi:hypothetical protein
MLIAALVSAFKPSGDAVQPVRHKGIGSMLKLVDQREDGGAIELALSIGSPQCPEDRDQFDIGDVCFLDRSRPLRTLRLKRDKPQVTIHGTWHAGAPEVL